MQERKAGVPAMDLYFKKQWVHKPFLSSCEEFTILPDHNFCHFVHRFHRSDTMLVFGNGSRLGHEQKYG